MGVDEGVRKVVIFPSLVRLRMFFEAPLRIARP
jgi:hypothetical protein